MRCQALLELALELDDRLAACAQQRELRLDVPARLVQDALALVGTVLALAERAAQAGARALGRDHRAQVVEREPEQLAQAHERVERLDVALVVRRCVPFAALSREGSSPTSS